jgi:predicted MFS family arabinose efflux permease
MGQPDDRVDARGGVVAASAFVVTERRSRHPMLPPAMFTERQFATTNAVTFLVYAGLGGALFLLPVTLEQVAGYSPLEAGLSLVPITAMMLLLSARSGKLAARIGPRLQMTIGPLFAGVGLLLMTRCVTDHNYLTGVLPGVFTLGCGLVLTVAPLTSTAMNSAPAAQAGIASAVNNDVARVGSLLAVAVLPVVSALTGDAYLHPHQFGHGFQTAGMICAVLCWLGAVIAGVGIRNRRHFAAS